jgi:integrator complex subunit 7
MRKCAKEFRTMADQYSSLFQSSFNADNQTLSHIQLLQNSCTIIAEAIECLFQTNRVSALFVSKTSAQLEQNVFGAASSSRTSVEHKQLSETSHRISQLVSKELVGASKSSTLDCSQISLLQRISEDLVHVPLCFPRLFFQSVQTTCIKLALSPQPKGDLLLINSSSNFVLKVEGVIVQNSKTQVRSVSKVMINVTSSVISKTNNALMDNSNLKQDTNPTTMNSLAIPHNDYFQTQFLLAFSCSGLHTITVEASIIDENEAQWKTGPVLNTSVKVVD